MARRPSGKLLRDAVIFLTGVAGFAFEVLSKHPNLGVMGLCSLWAGAPAFIPDNFLGSMFGVQQQRRRRDDDDER